MLETAATVGDGILINGSHPEDFKAAAAQIQKGLKTAGKTKDDIDVAAYTCFSIDEDAEKAYAAAKPVTAFIIAGAADPILERHGITQEMKKEIAGAISKGEFKSLNSIITDQAADRFAVIGDFDGCMQKAKALKNAGVTQLAVGSPIGTDKEKAIKLIGKMIREF